MQVHILPNADAVAERAADLISTEATASVSARGRCIIAFSGGRTPSRMLRALSDRKMPWLQTFIFQVDERVVPAGHSERNLSQLKQNLLARVPVPEDHVFTMAVEEPDLESAANLYMQNLEQVAGVPATLDCIHLGLGKDGHTASLVPGDRALDVTEVDVATTGIYEGTRRMTLTFPIINRARRVLWVVTGHDKRIALARLSARDPAFPAGRVSQDRAILLADVDATQ
jgi:6-phosphogluconolactonase